MQPSHLFLPFVPFTFTDSAPWGGGEVDYWEEVIAEDGSAYFYNHTTQEYSSTLPTTDDGNLATDDQSPTYATTAADEYPPPTTAPKLPSIQEGTARTEEEVWDGVDGEVFVPWREEEPGDMRASPEAELSDDPLNRPEGENIDEKRTPPREFRQTLSYAVQTEGGNQATNERPRCSR